MKVEHKIIVKGIPDDFVRCKECDKYLKQITVTHLNRHGMAMESYRKKYPNAPLRCGKLLIKQSKQQKEFYKNHPEKKNKLIESMTKEQHQKALKKAHSKKAEKKKSDHLLIIQNIPERKRHMRDVLKKVWEEQAYSKDYLIEEYIKLRDKLGRIPTVNEMKEHTGISVGPYWRRWGSWSKFLNCMGDGKIREWTEKRFISDKEIIDEYKKQKRKLGRPPFTTEFRYASCVNSRWGSWKNFISIFGDRPKRLYGISIEDLKKEYFKIKNYLKLKKSVTQDEYHKCYQDGIAKIYIYDISRRFGVTYNEFLFSIGEEPYTWDFVNKDLLIELYKQIKKEKGGIPGYGDIPFSIQIFKNNGFKTFNEFVKSMGDEPKKIFKLTVDEIISDILRIWEELGHQPTMIEYDKFGKYHSSTIYNKLGMRWADLMISMGGVNLGYLRGGYNKIPDEELEQEYIRIRKKIGKPLTQKDFVKHCKFSYAVFQRSWGSLAKAREYLEKKHFDPSFNGNLFYRKLLSKSVSNAKKPYVR